MTAPTRATILAYHAVGPCPKEQDSGHLFVSLEAFKRQISYLATSKDVVSLGEVVEGYGNRRGAVAITFDDAYRNLLERAAPVLGQYGLPATVFVPTGWLGRRNGWTHPPPKCDVEIMNDSALAEAVQMGFTLESHGHDHIDMAAAPRDVIIDDLQTSLDRLECIAGCRPRFLAYPFGRHGGDARAAARACGFDAAFTIDAPHEGRFAWARVPITPLDGPRLFALKASGHYLNLRYARPVARGYELVKPLVRRLLD